MLEALSAAVDTGEVVKPETLRASAGDGVVLVNEHVGLRLAPAKAGLSPVSLFGFEEEREFFAEGPAALWEVAAENSEQRGMRWTNEDPVFEATCTMKSAGNAAQLTWHGTGEAAGIDVVIDLRLDGKALRLQPMIRNTSDSLSILRVEMPKLSLGQIGASCEDDAFLTPTVSGTLWPSPLTKGVSCSAVYPGGWGTMQFGAHYDADGGLYIAAHDPVASTKTYRVNQHGGERAIAVRIEWPAPDASKPGNDFAFPGEIVVAVFQGDWFDAAQRYRAWAQREAQWWPCRGKWGRPDTPRWMKEVCVWGRPYGAAKQAVAPTLRFAEYMDGLPLGVHWYSWHEIPFDNNYPHYFPAKEGFAEGVAQMQEAGVRVMPYINGRLWDSDTDDFESVAKPAATKKRDGEYYVERYGGDPEDLVPMCPTQKVWQDKVSEIVLRLLGPECNVDGVYIDQVAAAAPVECYDASHGHPLAGGHWWTTGGYWPMLTALNQSIDKSLPDKMLTTECNAEPFAHLFDGYLTWNFQYRNTVPAFAAVYGGKVQMFGRAYNGNDTQAHWARTGQALVYGEQLGWATVDIVKTNPEAAAYLRRCGRVRHRLLPYLAQGYMARPPKVSGEIPEVTSDWAWSGKWMVTTSALERGAWRAEDGSLAFVFANTTNKPLTFTWDFDAGVCGLTGEAFATDIVVEDGQSKGDVLPARSQRPITLEALGVYAVIVRTQVETN
jgi:Domain of unknown function (DUF6259)